MSHAQNCAIIRRYDKLTRNTTSNLKIFNSYIIYQTLLNSLCFNIRCNTKYSKRKKKKNGKK